MRYGKSKWAGPYLRACEWNGYSVARATEEFPTNRPPSDDKQPRLGQSRSLARLLPGRWFKLRRRRLYTRLHPNNPIYRSSACMRYTFSLRSTLHAVMFLIEALKLPFSIFRRYPSIACHHDERNNTPDRQPLDQRSTAFKQPRSDTTCYHRRCVVNLPKASNHNIMMTSIFGNVVWRSTPTSMGYDHGRSFSWYRNTDRLGCRHKPSAPLALQLLSSCYRLQPCGAPHYMSVPGY
jgi:hypothetical protein